MFGNNNKKDPVKKCFTLSEEEIEKELSLIFGPSDMHRMWTRSQFQK
jgi:hypothetical protein